MQIHIKQRTAHSKGYRYAGHGHDFIAESVFIEIKVAIIASFFKSAFRRQAGIRFSFVLLMHKLRIFIFQMFS